MPTSLTATALPHSLADDAPFQLSVFFTHRLEGAGTTLAGFPAAQDWPATLAAAALTLKASKGVGRRQQVVEYPLKVVSAPATAAWQALFPSDLAVAPFPSPTLSAEAVQTNPASRMSEHAIDLQLATINTTPGVLPRVDGNLIARGLLETIAGLDPKGPVAGLLKRSRRGVGEALIDTRLTAALATLGPLEGPELNRREHDPQEPQYPADPGTALDDLLTDLEADRRVSEQLDRLLDKDLTGQPELRLLVDAHAMRRYHEVPEAPAPERPEPKRPDFHSRAASFGAVPALLRSVGLVVDAVLDGLTPAEARAALTDANSILVEVAVENDDLTVTPPRATAVRVIGASFQARSSDAWAGGALPLGNPEWVLLEADPDSAGLKLEQFLRNLPRQLAQELNGDPANAAPGSIRASGFSLARRGRREQVAERLTAAEGLGADPDRALLLDDVVRGYRVEVWDDASSAWHSLHQRLVDVTAQPSGTAVLTDAADVGFLQSSGLHREPGKPGLRLHEVVAGWDGWSLSAPRPGLVVERVPDPAPGEPSERLVAAPSDAPLDGAQIVTRVEPGTLPRLRYATSYSFRVLAVDLAGNSYPQDEVLGRATPNSPGGLPNHLQRLRRQFDALDGQGLAARAIAVAAPDEPLGPDRLREALHTGIDQIDLITASLLAESLPRGRGKAAPRLLDAMAELQRRRPTRRVRPQLRFPKWPNLRPPRPDPFPEPPADRAPVVTVTAPRPYLRWEPVAPPVVVARHELAPGEQLAVLVLREGGAQTAERHLAAPKATQLEAETAGLFDAAIGSGDPAAIRRLYAVALAERGTLLDSHRPSLTDPNLLEEQPGIRLATRPGAAPGQKTLEELAAQRGLPLAEGQYVVHDTDRLTLPYLPEPFADGVSLLFHEAGHGHRTADPSALQSLRVAYPGTWPELTPLRLVLQGGPDLDAWVDGHEIHVALPPGRQVELSLSSTLRADALERFGLWRSHLASIVDPADGYTPDELSASEALRRAALWGWLWWLTPETPLRLVNAVPTPVGAPRLRGLRILARPKDRGVVALAGLVDVDGASTDQLTVQAQWSENIDDPTLPAPTVRTSSDVVVNSTVAEHEATGVLHLIDLSTDGDTLRGIGLHKAIQNFPDTHRRLVTYRPGAASRFTEYFPDLPVAAPAVGDQVQLDVPSSARPTIVTGLDALPLFRWSAGPEPDGPFGWRSTRGSGIRLWLDRPWFSSGDGELLGVIVFDRRTTVWSGGKWVQQNRPVEPPDGAVSLWGADPILQPRGGRIGDATVPPLLGPEHLILDQVTAGFAGQIGIRPPLIGADASVWPLGPAQPVAVAGELPLLDVQDQPVVRVLGYRPEFDAEEGRWFVDLAVHNSPVPTPFVRLAVARWQPHSLPGCELSGVTLAPWVQPQPERVCTVNRTDAEHAQVTVTGLMGWLRDGAGVSELPGEFLGVDAPVGAQAAEAAGLLRSRRVVARLEHRVGPTDGDLGWDGVASVPLVPVTAARPATWTGSLSVPTELPLRRPGVADSDWRVVVEETELLDADDPAGGRDPRLLPRLVYADTVNL